MPYPGFTASHSLLRASGAYRSPPPMRHGGPPCITPATAAEGAMIVDAAEVPALGSMQQADCPSCAAGEAAGGEMASYVYAIGALEPRFPSLSIEKEFVQATGRAETARLSDGETLRRVLS